MAVVHSFALELARSAPLLVQVKHLAFEARVALLQVGRAVSAPIELALLTEAILVDETFDAIVALGSLLVFAFHAVEAHLLIVILIAIVAESVSLPDIHTWLAFLAACGVTITV